MSDPNPPNLHEPPKRLNPIDIYAVGMAAMEENSSLKSQAQKLRQAAKDAKKELEKHSKANRDTARAQARRSQFAGEVIMALHMENPMATKEFRVKLGAALKTANNDIRKLFGLQPRPVSTAEQVDKEGVSKAAGEEEKKPEIESQEQDPSQQQETAAAANSPQGQQGNQGQN